MILKRENGAILEIRSKNRLFALVFRKTLKADGVRFLTPLNYPMQIGVLDHKKGKKVGLHRHSDLKYKVNTTQEVLYVERGTARVTITDRAWRPLGTVTLTKGDFVLSVDGGHAVDIAKNTRIIEVKQGPYPGDTKAKILPH